MRGDGHDADLDEGRNNQGGDGDVDRRGGHAHAEDDRADSGEEQENRQASPGQVDHRIGELEAQSRREDRTDDDPGAGTRDRHRHGVPHAGFQGREQIYGRHGRVTPEKAQADQRDDRPERSKHWRVAGEQEAEEDTQGQQQVPSPREDLTELRQLVAIDATDSVLLGLEMHHEIHGGEVENRRNDRGDDDPEVADVQELGDQERSRTHDRRRDLAAG